MRPDQANNAEITLPVSKVTFDKVGSVYVWKCQPVIVPLANAKLLLAAVSQAAVFDGGDDALAGVMFECAT